MQFSNEKEIENIIMEAFENDFYNLEKRGLHFFNSFRNKRGKGKLFQQVNFVEYGIADLVYVFRCDNGIIFRVIELKNRELEDKDFEQCARYLTALKKALENATFDYSVIGALIGTGIKNCHYLANESDNISTYTLEYDLNGIKFHLSNEWHKPNFITPYQEITYSKVV